MLRYISWIADDRTDVEDVERVLGAIGVQWVREWVAKKPTLLHYPTVYLEHDSSKVRTISLPG